LEAAWFYLREILRDGDALLVVGAGDVEKIAFWAKEEFKMRDAGGGIRDGKNEEREHGKGRK
jgi:hypothetical protein